MLADAVQTTGNSYLMYCWDKQSIFIIFQVLQYLKQEQTVFLKPVQFSFRFNLLFFFFLNLHENANKMEKSLLCFQYYLQAKVCITSFYSPWLTCHSIRNTKRPKWVPYLLVIFTCVYASVENQKYRNQNVTCDFFRPAQENPVTHIIYDVTDQESKACNW